MMKLSLSQHGQVLGHALIAYGTYLVLNVMATGLQLLLTTPDLASSAKTILLPQALSASVQFAACIIAGLDIRDLRSSARVPALVFVCLAIGQFPLGTILSAYILLYLFVIFPSEHPEEVNSITD